MKEGIVDIFDAWLQSRLSNVHTALPGQIETYNDSDRIARVKPLIRLRTKKGTELSIPPIDNAPVVFPSAAGFTLKFPLVKGDGCLILFSEEGIGAFLDGRTEVTADNLAKFALTDAICIPGLFSKKGIPNSKATITVGSDGVININAGTKGVARDGDSVTIPFSVTNNPAWHTWFTALNVLVPGYPLVGPGGSLPGSISAGSTKVKSG